MDIIKKLLLLTPLKYIVLLYKIIKKEPITTAEILLLLISFMLPSQYFKEEYKPVIVKNYEDVTHMLEKVTNKDGIDFSSETYEDDKLTQLDITMLQNIPPEVADIYREYITLMTEASKKFNVPRWALLAFNAAEGGASYSKKPIIGGAEIPLEKYGKQRADGTIMNLETFGQKDFLEHGHRLTSNGNIVGPFQLQIGASWSEGHIRNALNKSYDEADPYNFKDALFVAASILQRDINDLKKLVPTITDDQAATFALLMYNSGAAGGKAKIGIENIQYFMSSTMDKILGNQNTVQKIYEHWEKSGRGWGLKAVTTQPFIDLGWLPNSGLVNHYANNGAPVQVSTTKEIVNNSSSYRINNSGNVEYAGDGNGHNAFGKLKWGISSVNPNTGHTMVLDYEGIEYMTWAAVLGKTADLQMSAASGINQNVFRNNTAKRIDQGSDKVVYGDEAKQIDDLAIGMKGAFPIYPQDGRFWLNHPIFDTLNQILFNGSSFYSSIGRNHTTGSSGCSIISLASVIHAVGLGEEPIPSEKQKGKDILPTLHNLSRILNNAPIVSSGARNLGYKTKSIVPNTAENKELLFQDLKMGYPYIVNVVGGSIGYYDKSGNLLETGTLTRGGHFLVLRSGVEINGERYVDIVNSNRLGKVNGSNFTKNDSNEVLFKYSEMLKLLMPGLDAYTVLGRYTSFDAGDSTPNVASSRINRDTQQTILTNQIQTKPQQDTQSETQNQTQAQNPNYYGPQAGVYRLTGSVPESDGSMKAGINITAVRTFKSSTINIHGKQGIVVPINTNEAAVFIDTTGYTGAEVYNAGEVIAITTATTKTLYATISKDGKSWDVQDTTSIPEGSI